MVTNVSAINQYFALRSFRPITAKVDLDCSYLTRLSEDIRVDMTALMLTPSRC